MDEGIGRLVKALEETGRDRNTLILFLSDNDGEPLVGSPHRALLSNKPFVRGKVSHFEGGMGTPFVAGGRAPFPATPPTPPMKSWLKMNPAIWRKWWASGGTGRAVWAGKPALGGTNLRFRPAWSSRAQLRVLNWLPPTTTRPKNRSANHRQAGKPVGRPCPCQPQTSAICSVNQPDTKTRQCADWHQGYSLKSL